MPTSTARLALVTGATGLLGRNLVHLLAAEGWRVRALVRSAERARVQFGELPVELVVGDVTERASVTRAVDGAEVLFHAAAHFRDGLSGARQARLMHAVNVEGTRLVLDAAAAAGVARVIHVSSIAVLDGPRGALIDATMRRAVEAADAYARSKLAADALVAQYLATGNARWAATVVPGWIHGPGDLGPTAAGRLLLDVVKGRIPAIPPGTVATVDARDVALAMLRAVERGQRGAHYLVAGPERSMREYMQVLAAATGRRTPRWTAPLTALYLAGAAGEAWSSLTGRPARFGLAEVRRIARDAGRTRFDHTPTERDLGITFRPLEETIRDSLDWFRRQGMA